VDFSLGLKAAWVKDSTTHIEPLPRPGKHETLPLNIPISHNWILQAEIFGTCTLTNQYITQAAREPILLRNSPYTDHMTFSQGWHATWAASEKTLHFYSNTLLNKPLWLQTEHSNQLYGSKQEVFSRSNDQASDHIVAESLFDSRQRK
jgi:hypothetical protein